MSGQRGSSESWIVDNSVDVTLALLPGTRMPFVLGVGVGVVNSSGSDEVDERFNLTVSQSFTPLYRPSLNASGVYSNYITKQSERLTSDQQFTFKWNDERIGITWPNLKPILSQRDR